MLIVNLRKPAAGGNLSYHREPVRVLAHQPQIAQYPLAPAQDCSIPPGPGTQDSSTQSRPISSDLDPSRPISTKIQFPKTLHLPSPPTIRPDSTRFDSIFRLAVRPLALACQTMLRCYATSLACYASKIKKTHKNAACYAVTLLRLKFRPGGENF